MNDYREQVHISCANCLHSYDIEYYEGTDLMCVEDLPISAKTLYKYYIYTDEICTDESKLIHKELARWREMIYNDTTRHVSTSGICNKYEKRGN